MVGLGKLTVLRYDNEDDPFRRSGDYSAWDTRYWSYGARTSWNDLVLIAQGLQRQTVIGSAFGLSYTLTSSRRFSWPATISMILVLRIGAPVLRGDVSETHHSGSSLMNEDGDTGTFALSWPGMDWLRVTGKLIAMQSRKGEYVLGGILRPAVQEEFQLSAKVLF